MTDPRPEAADPSLESIAPAPSPIVLGTDFGPVSAAAERAAIRAAAERGADLVIVHAIDTRTLQLPGGLWRERVDQARAGRERDAASVVARARAGGVAARVLIWKGDPATCLIEAAKAEGADRIVVGSHGRGRIGRLVAGSVSGRVIGQARCPVEIVAADPARPTPATTGPKSSGRTARVEGPFDT